MTATVLYNELLEPITIVDLPVQAYESDVTHWQIPIIPHLRDTLKNLLLNESIPSVKEMTFGVVTVRKYKFMFNEMVSCLFIVSDLEESLSLELKSALLPGQKTDAINRFDDLIVAGIMRGLS